MDAEASRFRALSKESVEVEESVFELVDFGTDDATEDGEGFEDATAAPGQIVSDGVSEDGYFGDGSSDGSSMPARGSARSKGILQLILSFIAPGAPTTVLNILLNEACERFSYYGLRAILTLYCVEGLQWDTSSAISMFFFSSALAYTMPLAGGWLADTYLGKYKTILYFSIIYVLGSLILALTSIGLSGVGCVLGLVLIAIGTGGIKPNVSAFGADQFSKDDKEALSRYFMVFYFCINCGSVLSFIITPIVRANFGFPAAFGIPSCLLMVATIIFFSGRKKYIVRRGGVSPVRKLFAVACAKWKGVPLYSTGDVSTEDVKDAEAVIDMSVVLLCLPTFWMLFDQQASAWTIQASTMNNHGLQPEQMGFFNPVLVLCLIPFFEKFVYSRFKLSTTKKIFIGMNIAALSFVLSAIVEIIIQGSEKKQVSMFLQLPQIISISVGEIFVSITGLEFAYANAPATMKSIAGSLFLLTTALGDIVGAAMYTFLGPRIPSTVLFFIFAVLMVCNSFVFLRIAGKYESSRGSGKGKGETLLQNAETESTSAA